LFGISRHWFPFISGNKRQRRFWFCPVCPSVKGSNAAVFFILKKEAARYVSRLHTAYKGRIISNPAHSGGQLSQT
jgi:hypothetical protein